MTPATPRRWPSWPCTGRWCGWPAWPTAWPWRPGRDDRPAVTGGGPQDRAAGALYGLAIGDALGMPTESLPRSQIFTAYGSLVDGFHPAPDGHPLAAGLPAGTVTDDTEQ